MDPWGRRATIPSQPIHPSIHSFIHSFRTYNVDEGTKLGSGDSGVNEIKRCTYGDRTPWGEPTRVPRKRSNAIWGRKRVKQVQH